MKNYGYWTKEKCREEAQKYNTRSEFVKGSVSAYKRAWSNDWLDDICSHMKVLRNRKITIEECQSEAMKYSSRVEFQKLSSKYYNKSHRKGWLDEVCKHMEPLGHKYKRMVYAYEFTGNYVYVGLTFDEHYRQWEHFNKDSSPVCKHIKENNVVPVYKKISYYVDMEIAKNIEKETLEKYKSKGWNILNRVKTGSVGGTTNIWTKDRCLAESTKYQTRADFIKNNPSAYNKIIKHDWTKECFSHMKYQQLPNGYWKHNKNRCLEEALKYDTKKSFRKLSGGAYSAACQNKWIEEICKHMNKIAPK